MFCQFSQRTNYPAAESSGHRQTSYSELVTVSGYLHVPDVAERFELQTTAEWHPAADHMVQRNISNLSIQPLLLYTNRRIIITSLLLLQYNNLKCCFNAAGYSFTQMHIIRPEVHHLSLGNVGWCLFQSFVIQTPNAQQPRTIPDALREVEATRTAHNIFSANVEEMSEQ